MYATASASLKLRKFLRENLVEKPDHDDGDAGNGATEMRKPHLKLHTKYHNVKSLFGQNKKKSKVPLNLACLHRKSLEDCSCLHAMM